MSDDLIDIIKKSEREIVLQTKSDNLSDICQAMRTMDEIAAPLVPDNCRFKTEGDLFTFTQFYK